MVAGRPTGQYYRVSCSCEGCRAILQNYRRLWWLRGLVGLQGHTTGHHGSLEGYRAILQGTVVAARAEGHTTGHTVAGRAAGPYSSPPWWLGGLQYHTKGHRGVW